MKSRKWIIGLLLLASIGIGIALVFQYMNAKPVHVIQGVNMKPLAAEPEIRYPIQATQTPLPALDKSDPTLWGSLNELFGERTARQFFRPEQLARHFVVTIDNLPRETAAERLLPTKPMVGRFQTAGTGKRLVIADGNASRYTRFIRLAEAVETKKLVAAYVQFYPLFQQAYKDLGYPKGYFNDRLIAVIDHLLDTPEVKGPVEVVQRHVLYEFADPELEAESAGRKVLMRMGPKNASRVKAKLQDIRQELLSVAAEKE
jgi:hypothetical protein